MILTRRRVHAHLVLMSLALHQAAPTTSSSAPPETRHMVRDGVISPLRAYHAVEWYCVEGGKPSRIKISVEDTGKSPRNYRFTFKLMDLVVSDGRPSAATSDRVKSLLASLNNISIFEGGCRQNIPNLVITGHTLEGRYRPAREYRFDLN